MMHDKGYYFIVDLHYPENLHKQHNGYALCSENKSISNNLLSTKQSASRKETKIKKLVCSFEDKKEYGIHYRYLKQALQLGLKITKIHKTIEFTQSDFMAGYINKNTQERIKAKTEFEKDLYKLMNNSVYGKTMENVRNYSNFKFVTSEDQLDRLRNVVKSYTFFNENLIGVHQLKKKVVLNKPIFLGQCILDQSKIIMYDFYYNFIMKKFNPDNVKLLLTDTDSLILNIKNEDPYEVMKSNKDYFDLSNFPKTSSLYDNTNNKIIGKFKDEMSDNYISEFVGLRSKMYALRTEAG